MSPSLTPLNPVAKLRLAVRIYGCYLHILVQQRRTSLPELIRRLGIRPRRLDAAIEPNRLGRIVFRVLRVRSYAPRCLYTSLVLYRLLARQGTNGQIVIGLERLPEDKNAHAWVEVDGVDVGPPPGAGRHQELARYP